MWPSWKLGVLCRWSMRRPGVAISTSGPALSAASWDLRSSPPAGDDSGAASGWRWGGAWRGQRGEAVGRWGGGRTDGQAGGDGGELGQLAGHRVHLDAQLPGGHQDQDPGHLGCLGLVDQALQHRQHEGSRLPWGEGGGVRAGPVRFRRDPVRTDSPVPVAAQAHRSRPSRPTGMQAFWMGVGCWKPSAVTACRGSQSHASVSKQPTNPSRAGTTSCYILLPETTGASEASRRRHTPMTSTEASLTSSLTFGHLRVAAGNDSSSLRLC